MNNDEIMKNKKKWVKVQLKNDQWLETVDTTLGMKFKWACFFSCMYVNAKKRLIRDWNLIIADCNMLLQQSHLKGELSVVNGDKSIMKGTIK